MRGSLERLAALFRFERGIASNIAIKAASDVLVKASRFVLVIGAARLLGPGDFGLYSLAFAIASMLAILSDLGLHLHLARQVALAEQGADASLGEAVSGKLAMSGLVLVALAAVVLLYPRPAPVRWLLVLAGLALLGQSWCELWNHLFRGLQTLGPEAALNLFNALVGAGAGVAVLLAGGGPHGLYAALLATAIATNVAALVLARARGVAAAGVSGGAARRALQRAYPAGIAILLSMVYFRIDLVLLERLRDDAEVGAYAAAYRLLEGLLFIPAFFMAALFPALSEVSRKPDDLKRLLEVGLRWMFLLSGLLALMLLVAAPWALWLLYGESYVEAAPALRVLSLALLFIFPNYLLTHLLVATGRQRWNALIAGVCVLVNVGLNLPAIHRFGALGAAATTVVTEGVLFALATRALAWGATEPPRSRGR
ncbi:MAG TPA: flippase [Vicinamibacteria bacterium]|nr:flippase [Vicinamibacteria bacterium]